MWQDLILIINIHKFKRGPDVCQNGKILHDIFEDLPMWQSRIQHAEISIESNILGSICNNAWTGKNVLGRGRSIYFCKSNSIHGI